MQHKSPWLAVKAHFSGEFPNDLVGLYNFKGGYCGVSKVENDIINICYLVHYDEFREFKNINDFQNLVMKQNPYMNEVFENTTMLFDKPLTISQISFEEKAAVENHIMMIGDTAGLIHPLCGNGMAMAIHSAKIASELITSYTKDEIKSRAELEKKYIQIWNATFKSRLKTGRLLTNALLKPKLLETLMKVMNRFPLLLNILIKKTHGKPITI